MEPKIKVPAAWAAERDKEADRKKLVGEWKSYLGGQQRKALDEEGTVGGFKSRLTIDAIKSFTPSEVDELTAHEEAEYRRFKPLAEARSTQRAAWVNAGGEAEDFDTAWSDGFGREETIAAIAGGQDLGPAPGEYASPY